MTNKTTFAHQLVSLLLFPLVFLSGLPAGAFAFAVGGCGGSTRVAQSPPRPLIIHSHPPAETRGLYYLRARLMNPLTGRFWNADSYEGNGFDPASLHKYLYANADPVNGMDPSGHLTLVETLTVVNTIATVASIAYGAYQISQGNYAEGSLEIGLAAFWGISGTRKAGAFARWWLFNRGIRTAYLKGVKEIGDTVVAMRKSGKTVKAIAEKVVQLRNEAKVAARKLMKPEDAAKLANSPRATSPRIPIQ